MTTIPHAFVEVTTEQLNATSPFIDVPGAVLASSNFVAGRKYLIVVIAHHTSLGGRVSRVQLIHGSTLFAKSDQFVEPDVGLEDTMYFYFTVWTAIASEDIKLQFAGGSGSRTAIVDQITMFALEISELFVENQDWFYDEVDAVTPLTTTFSTTNNASVTFTPIKANDDWLVFVIGKTDFLLFQKDGHESRMQRTGEATETEPLLVAAPRDAPSQDRLLLGGARVFTLGLVSNTFTQQHRNISNNNGDRDYSAVFAINLSKFEKHSFSHTEAEIALSTTDFATEVQTASITPTRLADVWCFGAFNEDEQGIDGLENGHARLQVDEVDQPPTQTSDLALLDWAGEPTIAEETLFIVQTVENLDNTSHKIDVDASKTVAGIGAAEDRCIFAVQLAVRSPPSQHDFEDMVAVKSIDLGDMVVADSIDSSDMVLLGSTDFEDMVMVKSINLGNNTFTKSIDLGDMVTGD